MIMKRFALAIAVSMLALSACSVGAHLSVGEKAPAATTQSGVPG